MDIDATEAGLLTKLDDGLPGVLMPCARKNHPWSSARQ